jgi:hypothetical protein
MAMIQWPHAPVHKLAEPGAFMVTTGTYRKEHHFRKPSLLEFLYVNDNPRRHGLVPVASKLSLVFGRLV